MTYLPNKKSLILTNNSPLVFSGREVIFLTAETSTDNTKVVGRFTGIQARIDL